MLKTKRIAHKTLRLDVDFDVDAPGVSTISSVSLIAINKYRRGLGCRRPDIKISQKDEKEWQISRGR